VTPNDRCKIKEEENKKTYRGWREEKQMEFSSLGINSS
jgi:hypothetical protein